MSGCGQNDWCIPVFIKSYNGSDDYAGIGLIDTGASHSLIPADTAERLGLPVVGHRDVQTANGYAQMPLVFAEIQVGEHEYIGANLLVTPTGDLVAVGKDLVTRLGLLEPTQVF
jgi:predicted aspartyl protease